LTNRGCSFECVIVSGVPLRHGVALVRTAAIVAAGGRGQRFGSSQPKQRQGVAGRAILDRTVAALLAHDAIDEVVVALPAEIAADPPPYLRVAGKPLRVVTGGSRRQDSVANAFAVLDDRVDLVVVHDAARPFVTGTLITRTLEAAVESGAAVAALASHDTVKRASDDRRFVAETLPRERIFLAQTPQAFRYSILRDALALAEQGGEATDEATLAERAGHPVRLVMGEPRNIKITRPEDLDVAEALARGGGTRDGTVEPRDPGWRIGTGYDLHRLVEGRPLILAGVTVPFERGLIGHSDADAVCHAVTDAILGAAAAGDIGRHFPDTDPRYAGASSIDLLRQAVSLVRQRGFSVVNVDVVVVAERPKIGPYGDAMRASLASALSIPSDCVSVKGKTNEGVDATGRGEAIATHAVALLCRVGG
jgi:2-C-methyl-D-erythritol 4-phosphate cytidylyltransferase / 2-C-methyl-D-erythritol 2,4-cyclodiphosphate synthase